MTTLWLENVSWRGPGEGAHGLGRGRPIAAAASGLLTPVALHVPALVALALVATVWIGLHAYELIGWREQRARRRGLPQTPA